MKISDPSQTPTRLIIADDSPTFRAGIKTFLDGNQYFEVVAEVENGHVLLSMLGSARPDVILLDIKMPQKDGIDCTKFIRSRFPEIKILIISNYYDLVFIKNLTDKNEGAHGYLLKNVQKDELLLAIRKVSQNRTYLSDEVWSKLAKLRSFNDLFSSDELETLMLFCKGLKADEIAKKVHRTKYAIDARMRNIYSKTDCKNQWELQKYLHDNELDHFLEDKSEEAE